MRKLLLGLLFAALAALPGAASASPYVTIHGAPGPGPAKYDRVFVQKLGPKSAKNVLVLVPGFQAGAGSLTPVARDIARRVPGLQVWTLDRREQVFEDTSVFRRRDPVRAERYYLGFKYHQVDQTEAPFARRWGLDLSLRDLRRVVLAARAGGKRRVILGGHSLGASTTVAYAGWDFGGRPGWKDLSGLVLIDGGLGVFGRAPTLDAAKATLKDITEKNPFADLLGLGIPSIAGVFAEIAALYADKLPNRPSALQQNSLIPPAFKPPVRATNLASLGFGFDASTSPAGLALIHINAGHLARTGDPRGWVDGQFTPIERFAHAFGAERPNATEWYFPRRLSLDVSAANALHPTPVTRLLGVRITHVGGIRLPFYAFQTNLTQGGVLRGARTVVRRSQIRHPVLVSDERMSHLDPVVGKPSTNTFLKTVVPFLRKIVAR